MALHSKAWQKCDSAEKILEEAEEHECPKNFEGRSKIMEDSAILKMVEDAFYNCLFIIGVVFRESDSTMQAVLKHPSKGAWGQVIK